MKKYKDIFKDLVFWSTSIVLVIYQILALLDNYESLLFLDVLGIFIGSFVICLIVYSLIFFIKKIIIKSSRSLNKHG